jgi:hypothetical protein
MLEKPLLFPIKPGVVAAWNARAVVIVGPTDGSSTRVHDVATGEERDVSVDELQGIPAIAKLRALSKGGRWFGVQRERSGSKRGVANGS